MKIRTKITLLFTFLVTAILLLLSLSVYYFTALERQNVFYQRLQSRANYNGQIYSLLGDSSITLLDRINRSAASLFPRFSVEILTLKGEELYHFEAEKATKIPIEEETLSEVVTNGKTRIITGNREALAFLHHEGDSARVLVVAAFDEDGWSRLTQLKHIFLFSVLAGILLSFLVGYFFSRQLLSPIAGIIEEVNDISSQNLSKRIHAGSSQDEMSKLATTFNGLLDRLQESFDTQRRFISNASHEMSTPLTSISSQLQVALQRERSTEEYRQVIQSVQEDVQQMLQLTKSLLEIAKTGSQGGIELDNVRIDEVLLRVIADVHRISPEYRVELDFGEFPEDERNFVVFGNSDLLYISIKNIVENGCKFSNDHLSSVNLFFSGEDIRIEVHNTGDVIAENETDHIFQPFYRSASATATPGFGLGLALARRIVGLHKGTISVESSLSNGTVFNIILPTVNSLP